MSGSEIAIVVGAISLGAMLKSLTGMGLPAIAIPLISFFVGIEQAVAVVALPNLMSNVAMTWRERSHLDETRDLGVLAAAGLVGAVTGTLLLVTVPEEPLVIMLLLAVAGYIVAFFARPDVAVSPETSRRWAPAVGLTAGVFQGSIGISGPVFGSWIHSYRLPRGAHVLSVTTLFLVAGSAQIVVLALSGKLAGLIVAALLACIPTLATVPVGSKLRDRISTKAFDYVIVVALAVAATSLGLRTFL